MAGRKPWIPPDPKQVEKIAESGLSQREIAIKLGISYETLRKKKKDNKEFEEAIERGRATAHSNVSNKLMQAAMGGSVSAMIYFLKCRYPKLWNEKVIEAELARAALNEQLAKASENTGVLHVPVVAADPNLFYAQIAAQQAASKAFVEQKVKDIDDDN